jgi:hypothetical protein
VEGLPSLAAATGADGLAEFEVFWQGPARVKLGDLEAAIQRVEWSLAE